MVLPIWKDFLPVHVTLLGQLTFRAGKQTKIKEIGDSKKMTSLLSYLLINADRSVPIAELVAAIWPETTREDPVNALKTLIYRVRTQMKDDGIPYYKECILVKSGSYRWNSEIPCEIDVDEFESLCKLGFAPRTTAAKKEEYLARVLPMYNGGFLPNCADNWMLPLSTYYKSLYLKSVLAYLELLIGRKEYITAVDICRNALVYEPYEEILHYNLILGLSNLSRYDEALAHYSYVTKLFFSKFGIALSEKMCELYKTIVESEKHTAASVEEIKKDLVESGEICEAFSCPYALFKQIYRLQSRMAERSGINTFVALVSLTGKSGRALSVKRASTEMAHFLKIAQKVMRRGDLISQFSASQFVMMMTAKKAEGIECALDRVIVEFMIKYPKSYAVINYKAEPITAKKARKK